jgi:transcriptional activator of cad operon
MEHSAKTKLRLGDWCVQPASSQISRDGVSVRVEARTMLLLLCLAEHPGEVVSIEDLLDQVWAGVTVSQDSVYQAVTSLRRLLGDDTKQPRYIETVPRLGYRLVAKVSPWQNQPDPPDLASPSNQSINHTSSSRPSEGEHPTQASVTIAAPRLGLRRQTAFTGNGFRWIAGATTCVVFLALALVFLARDKFTGNHPSTALAPQPEKSIAVLPFLDLTEGMKNEEFADGMTEELIDKLSKIPGLRVPSPTSSFYFKDKQLPVADIAKKLGVTYVLDGSVRKSGAQLRVAARLMRADNGYIVWSESYDRPFNDILMVQDDIAGEVTKALRSSLEARPDH